MRDLIHLPYPATTECRSLLVREFTILGRLGVLNVAIPGAEMTGLVSNNSQSFFVFLSYGGEQANISPADALRIQQDMNKGREPYVVATSSELTPRRSQALSFSYARYQKGVLVLGDI